MTTLTVAEMRAFLEEHYRHERLTGRGEDYAHAVASSRLRDLNARGHDLISRHESVRGVALWYRVEDGRLTLFEPSSPTGRENGETE